MAFNLPKINPEFVKKNPLVYAYIILFVVLGFFVSSWVKTSNSRNSDCAEARKQDAITYQAQIDALQRRLDKDDSTLNDLYQQLLISNGIINRLPQKLDSISKRKYRK